MKTLFISITLFFALQSTAQIQYVNTDWIIDLTQVMADGEADTLEFDFDQNGTKDMRISAWSNHQSGIQTAVEVLMFDAVGFGGLQVSGSSSYISDCPASGFQYQSIVGYIYTSNALPNPYTNQYVKMPFRFHSAAGTHCGLLYVRYEGSPATTTIKIEGYAWNQTPEAPCDCNSTGWLGLNKYQMNESKGDFEYYNLLGQRVENPEGFTLKVYESGISEKVFIVN